LRAAGGCKISVLGLKKGATAQQVNYTTYGNSIITSLILQGGIESHDDGCKGIYLPPLAGMAGRLTWW
jgi:hypothetical protein